MRSSDDAWSVGGENISPLCLELVKVLKQVLVVNGLISRAK